MQAVRLHAARDIRVDTVPEPGDPGPGEVLVKTSATGIWLAVLVLWPRRKRESA